jgi:Lysozyme like domain
MARKDKKPSAAPWVVAVAAGGMLASGFGGGASAAPVESSSKSPSTSQGAVVAQAAKDAGFTGNDLVIAIAVAKAESRWQPSVVSPTNADGTKDCGLWQTNSIHKDLLRKNSCGDPKANARMARQVWKNAHGSWSPWYTYKSGKHLAFISEARNLAAGVQ